MVTTKCSERDMGKHNWILRGTHTKDQRPSDNRLYPPLYRWCNFCGEEDHEIVLCEESVRSPGRWISWHTCGQKAAVEVEGKHYCKRHDPVAVKQKQEAAFRADREKFDREIFVKTWGWNADKTLPILRDLAEWAKANPELVEADEWLGAIVKYLGKIQLPEEVRG